MTLDRDRVIAALPSYEVNGELGRGGFGIVLEGRHRQLGREVAIKQLPRAFATDPAVRARFLAEARLLASLDHPHVVPVFDFVEQDGLCLLVMEKLSGGTVWSRFTGEGIAMDVACALTLAACAGLHCAHEQGILHRDVKPENLMFSATGVVKVTDFGIAKVLGGSETLATRAGDVLGTPAYMAPEQAQAGALSASTDVYAIGTMLYELLSGRLPFPDDGDALALLYRHAYEPPAPLDEVAPQIPSPLRAEVMRAIATDPADRHGTAEAFGVAVAEAATVAWGPGWLGRSDLPVMAAGAMVAATERTSGPVPEAGHGGGEDRRGGVVTGDGRRAPVTEPDPSTAGGVPAGPPPARTHPTVTVHTKASLLDVGDEVELLPVHEVIERPPRARVPALLAAALLVLVFVVALVATADRSSTGTLSGAVTLNGVDLSGPVELDLADPVIVAGTVREGTPAPSQTALHFSVLGVSLGTRSSTVEQRDDGTFTASVDATGLRYLVAGEVRARLELRDAEGRPLGDRRFPVSSSQPSFLTIPGIAALASALFVAAYAESLLRSRRRGRKRLIAPVGLALVGGLAGVVVVALAWIVGGKEPSRMALVLGVLLGAAAGQSAVVAASRIARSRRFGRAGRRGATSAGRPAGPGRAA